MPVNPEKQFELLEQKVHILMGNGEPDRGLKFIQFGDNLLPGMYGDEVALYLRSAQYYIEKGDKETGIQYLRKLCCETSSNYEESIGFRGLTHVWEKYRHFVDGTVPPSVVTMRPNDPRLPKDCSKQIEEIIELSKDDLLLEVIDHLDELSGYGDYMNWLNKWERIVYDVNELCTRINADGVEDFLYARGHRLRQTRQALETIGALKSVQLLDFVEAKFPKGKVPKSSESIENKMMSMLEKDETIFDDVEDFFENENLTEELEEKLYHFIKENKRRFR